MNRFRVSVVGSVLFIAVALTLVLMASHKSAAQNRNAVGAAQNPNVGPDVNIAGPLPLPVTGTLSLANGSAVAVNNPASSPVLVRDVDRGTPFQISRIVQDVNFLEIGPVPTGQRWIIEHVSSDVEGVPLSGAVSVNYFFLLTTDGSARDVLIPQTTAPLYFVANSHTKFIVNPGQTVRVGWNGVAGLQFSTSAFISGVIVPAP